MKNLSLNPYSRGASFIQIFFFIATLTIILVFLFKTLNPISNVQKSLDQRRKNDLAQIQNSLDEFYQNHAYFPASSTNFKIIDLNGNELSFGKHEFSPYMGILPQDPLSFFKRYAYIAGVNLQSYHLYASLSITSDSDLCNNGNWCQSIDSSIQKLWPCGKNAICNYSISSPNVTR